MREIRDGVGCGLLVFIAAAMIVSLSGKPVFKFQEQPSGPDQLVLPPELVTTPEQYHVGDMKDGLDGWVSSDSIWVDADSHIWISRNWAATRTAPPWLGLYVHIKREGEYIILFRVSLGNRTWTPGAPTDLGVEKEKDLLPVKLR